MTIREKQKWFLISEKPFNFPVDILCRLWYNDNMQNAPQFDRKGEGMGNTTDLTNAEKPKRKTHTSSAVKRRYNNKTYSRITVDLSKALVAEFKETLARNGETTASVLRAAIEKYIAENK